jgi:hypothetical protein
MECMHEILKKCGIHISKLTMIDELKKILQKYIKMFKTFYLDIQVVSL